MTVFISTFRAFRLAILPGAALLAPFSAAPLLAQQPQGMPAGMPMPVAVNTPDQPGAIPLYPDMKRPAKPIESWMKFGDDLVARNVTYPTITPVLPDPAKATGAAVIVAPGGAFMLLAMDHEGYSTAHWLADHGIAAFVLKYRTIETPDGLDETLAYMGQRMAQDVTSPDRRPTISEPRATEDGLAAMRFVRARAKEWGIDSKRVGMIGFSAGAMTVMNTAVAATNDTEKPAFIGYIYGPMLPMDVPENAPPMFAAIAMDDSLFKFHGLGLIDSWRKAGRPVELHAYERGDHGFGIGKPGTTTMGVMPQFLDWLEMRGLLVGSN
jgi:acetyl esterase/lipase